MNYSTGNILYKQKKSLLMNMVHFWMIKLARGIIHTFSSLFKKMQFTFLRRKKRKLHVRMSLLTGQNEKIPDRNGSEKYDRIFEKIKFLFEEEKIYLDPGLSIQSLADKLTINENYISKAIFHGSGKHFPRFLNTYRVQEAMIYLDSPDYNTLSLKEISKKSGFYSRSTFNAAFKNLTNVSPGEYRKSKQNKFSKQYRNNGGWRTN